MIKNESAVRGVCSLRMYSETVFKNRITCKKKNIFKKMIDVLERKEYTPCLLQFSVFQHPPNIFLLLFLADCECLIFAELLERSIKVFNTVSKAVEVCNNLRENVWHKAGSLLLGAYRLTTVKILFKIVAWISLLLQQAEKVWVKDVKSFTFNFAMTVRIIIFCLWTNACTFQATRVEGSITRKQ